jgi:hypothetical protein
MGASSEGGKAMLAELDVVGNIKGSNKPGVEQ